MQAAAKKCEIPESHLWIFDVHGQSVPPELKSWTELLSQGESDWIKFNDEEISKRTPAALLFSSGTTGLPKAAVVSHYNLVAQHTLAIEPQRVPFEVSKALSEHLLSTLSGLTHGHRFPALFTCPCSTPPLCLAVIRRR